MPKRKGGDFKDLYGDYPKFTQIQKDYLKILTDPNTKLRNLTEDQIAEVLGVTRQYLNKLRRDNPDFREAIIKETFLKSADELPDQINDLAAMSMGWGRHKDCPPNTQLQAKKLWWSVMGFVDEAKARHQETQQEVRTSFEKKLMELDNRYKPDSMEAEE